MEQSNPPGVFEMLKIGIGPSSSHTLGPWRGAARFAEDLINRNLVHDTKRVGVELYGSLALTGKGHGTDIAVILGLSGADPVTVPLSEVSELPRRVRHDGVLLLGGITPVPFIYERDIRFFRNERLPEHANGMVFFAEGDDGVMLVRQTAYSIGGGFILFEGDDQHATEDTALYDLSTGASLLQHCRAHGTSIAAIARENELARAQGLLTEAELDEGLIHIWHVMRDAVHRGSQQRGMLPGELHVQRRAPDLIQRVTKQTVLPDPDRWLEQLSDLNLGFAGILTVVGAFSIAVNEENAAFGRIVTAPTNGSAGVIPAVLLYYRYLSNRTVTDTDVANFLLVAAAIGGIFKVGATISAAMGGCQAEIGVSSAMAAAALTEGLGGSPEQAVMAAEIAMEHHLGLTCDPIAGLVQIPCIERNSMGAIKAITAAHIALESESALAKVSLDAVVRTMWQTAQDMNMRYKETSLGGLAVNVAVSVPEC